MTGGGTGGGATIAIVDDDRSIRTALSSLLRSAGYTTLQFESAEAYLAQAGAEPPDCIVTDIQMPGMSGIEFIERLRSAGTEAPVLVITAFPEPAIRRRALELGARAFLSKPFDAAAILASIEEAIA